MRKRKPISKWTETEIARGLNISYPIIQGAFGRGGSSALLAATIANAGGLGSYGANNQGPADIIKIAANIRKVTDKPFGLNLWLSTYDVGGELLKAETMNASLITEPKTNMKTKKQIELTPTAATRPAVPLLAFAIAVIPVLAADGSGAAAAEDSNAIRPFHINIPESALADLRQRVLATRWPGKETVSDRSQGVQLAKLQALVSYWGTDYDWRKVEAKLNALPMFVTTIDGLDIQFIHVRSPDPNALPLIITHGWPGSILELVKVIGPLTDPTTYGGRAEDAFDVVIPSMPGYGFSGKPQSTGWGPERIARAWAVLMERLGYKRYVSQGGRLGFGSCGCDGTPGAAGTLRHPRQYACDRASGCSEGAQGRRPGAGRAVR